MSAWMIRCRTVTRLVEDVRTAAPVPSRQTNPAILFRWAAECRVKKQTRAALDGLPHRGEMNQQALVSLGGYKYPANTDAASVAPVDGGGGEGDPGSRKTRSKGGCQRPPKNSSRVSSI